VCAWRHGPERGRCPAVSRPGLGARLEGALGRADAEPEREEAGEQDAQAMMSLGTAYCLHPVGRPVHPPAAMHQQAPLRRDAGATLTPTDALADVHSQPLAVATVAVMAALAAIHGR